MEKGSEKRKKGTSDPYLKGQSLLGKSKKKKHVQEDDAVRGNNKEKEEMRGVHAQSPASFPPRAWLPSTQGPAHGQREK